MSASDAIENEILVRYLSGPVWVALYDNDPVEPSTPTTTPLPLVAGASSPVVPSQIGPRRRVLFTIKDNVARSSDEIQWETLPPRTVEALGLWTEETGGLLMFHGRLTHRRVIEQGKPFRILAGSLTVAVD